MSYTLFPTQSYLAKILLPAQKIFKVKIHSIPRGFLPHQLSNLPTHIYPPFLPPRPPIPSLLLQLLHPSLSVSPARLLLHSTYLHPV